MSAMNGQIAAVSDSWKSINLVTGGSSGSGLSVPLAGDPATWEKLQNCTLYSVQYSHRDPGIDGICRLLMLAALG